MKSKIILICSVIVLLVCGLFYIQNNKLIADDKDGKKSKKDCSSTCTQKSGAESSTDNSINNAGANYAVYEFVTDKVHCDGCKTGISDKLMSVAGVKEINYGETCQVSHMTNVKVFYSETDTTPEIIAASIKENNLSCESKCGDGSKCTGKEKSEKKL